MQELTMMKNLINKFVVIKKFLFVSLAVVTIGLGWKLPVLGYIVPVVMLTAVVLSLYNGRYHCGNICPRGMFLSVFFIKKSKNALIPVFLKKMSFRLMVMGVLMGFLVFRIAQNPTSIDYVGRVFWLMCAVTTGVGIILGFIYKPRTWCSFCPVGTMQKIIGRHSTNIQIDKNLCLNCKVCEKKCPINIDILSTVKETEVTGSDCLKCSLCISQCPKKALSWGS
ncbi:MAG TPA: hypothetical protein DCS13_12095 [Candidatus Margulisbacteria bacterium]|nr:hypothetical protein [Candidatus Margulisiibacteriota bacterium]